LKTVFCRPSAAGRLAGALVVLGLAIPGSAAAQGPYEPNETQGTATGPLLGSTAYTAAIERLGTDDGGPPDVDWYVFYTEGPVRLDIAYSNLQSAQNCFGPEARLLDPAGNLLGTAQPPSQRTEHIVHQAPGPGQYFLRIAPYHIEPCPPPDEPYRFEIGPLGTTLATPPGQTPVQPVPVAVRKLNPGLTITSMRFRNGRLYATGRLRRGASPRRIRIVAWRTVSRRLVTFTMIPRSAGTNKWVASALVRRRLRGFSYLRFRVTYLADSRFAYSVLRARSVQRARR
jgi:hypothetical protein